MVWTMVFSAIFSKKMTFKYGIHIKYFNFYLNVLNIVFSLILIELDKNHDFNTAVICFKVVWYYLYFKFSVYLTITMTLSGINILEPLNVHVIISVDRAAQCLCYYCCR